MTGADRVVFASIPDLVVTVITMLWSGCPIASILVGLSCVPAVAPSTVKLEAFPLTILKCRGDSARISIDQYGIIEFERTSARGNPLYAKVSVPELVELRAVVESDAYRRAIGACQRF